VACVNHIVRDQSGDGLGPHRIVHNDYTKAYPARMHDGLGGAASGHRFWDLLRRQGLEQAHFRPGDTHRLVVLNMWRSRSAVPLKTAPLALCDRRTVAVSDLAPVCLPGYNGETIDPPHEISLGHPAEAHRWWYYPDLLPDEIVCFTTFDSAPSPFIPTLHSAFDDPTTPPRYPPRESVECRVVCLLPAQGSASGRAKL